MPCSCTSIGFRSKYVNPETGLRRLVFNRSDALHPVEEQTLSLGTCLHCRLKKSKQWGLRVALESTLYKNNSFITLTYNSENLPKNSLLDYDAPVLFMKRLRFAYGNGIRSFGCAEYGEKFSRPHYHLCLLNHDFPDKKIIGNSNANWGKLKRENPIFHSEELQHLWPHGYATIGSLTLESAQYVARYCTKKITGKNAPYHYDFVDQRSGEILTRPPEKLICASRSRGLGFPYYEKYGDYIRNHDHINFNGFRHAVPSYFDRLTQKFHSDRWSEIKEKRRIQANREKDKLNEDALRGEVNVFQRILTIEKCLELSFKQLKRNIENG